MTRRRSSWSGEEGSAVVELTWLGILLLVPIVWVVMAVFEVQSGAYGVSSAARAAGRAYALAGSDAEGQVRAEQAARQALVDQGHPDAPLAVRVTCTPYPDDCHSGTSVITVRVVSSVALPAAPRFLGTDAAGFALDASHTVPIGQYQEVG